MQALGKNVPIVYNMHNAPSTVQRMVGGMDAMNGDYEAHAAVIAGSDDSEAKRFYDLLVAKHGMKQPWNSFTAIGIGQAMVLVRAVEARLPEPYRDIANYNNGADWNAQDGNVTSAGTAGRFTSTVAR